MGRTGRRRHLASAAAAGANSRGAQLRRAAAQGAALGLAGVAVMTVGEKAEQALTHRPDSYVPARTLLTLLGHRPAQHDRPLVWNHLMHYGTGA
ncbi:MAG TPA: hypothetical protein VFR07_16400, partial [Mycobacteriales bacterium]|nr:hypothetical protein [Mycobacteriales bacterium]